MQPIMDFLLPLYPGDPVMLVIFVGWNASFWWVVVKLNSGGELKNKYIEQIRGFLLLIYLPTFIYLTIFLLAYWAEASPR